MNEHMTILERFSQFYTDIDTMQIDQLSTIYSQEVVFIDPIAEYEGLKSVERYFAKLLTNAAHCQFMIHSMNQTVQQEYVLTWTMTFTSSRLNRGKPINVDGITQIRIQNNKICFHRDYYDVGQMIYENVPILGYWVKKIKERIN